MIILDTNVVSEMMKSTGQPEVLRWLVRRASQLFITTVTQAEILYGIEILPKGRRREGLAKAAAAMFEAEFADRILPFDSEAAVEYAQISAMSRSLGHPINPVDAQIAAIARSSNATLVTRNVSDFESCGISLVNPWVER
jgi:predicted nucleic acid-binding protein